MTTERDQPPPAAQFGLAVLIFIGGLCALVGLILGVYTKLVPAHSAEFHIKELDATVGVQFYWLWDEAYHYDSGTYFTVSTPRGTSLTRCVISFGRTGAGRAFISRALAVSPS
jgi:hypothetical protein